MNINTVAPYHTAALTFDYDRATNNLKQHSGMPVSADFSMYKTSATNNGQRDWIAEIGARASNEDWTYMRMSDLFCVVIQTCKFIIAWSLTLQN